MSNYLIYFETKNSESTNYSGFAEVGKFFVPNMINAGKCTANLKQKKYNACLVSGEDKQCSNNFFMKNPMREQLISVLNNFVIQRTSNSCVIGNLASIIYTRPTEFFIKSNPVTILKENFLNEFKSEFFEHDQFMQVRS